MTDSKHDKPTSKPTVKIVRHDYQPSRQELEEDVRVNATFEEAVDALTRSVNIQYIDKPDDG